MAKSPPITKDKVVTFVDHKPSRPPPASQVEAIRWLRKNLFSSGFSTLVTLFCAWLVYKAVVGFVSWGFVDAHWVINQADITKSCPTAGGACWAFIRDTWSLFVVGTYPYEIRWRPFLALGVFFVMVAMAFVPAVRRTKTYLWVCLLLPIPLLHLVHGAENFGFSKVSNQLLGGLLITVLLSVGSITLAFPMGMALALGRRSTTMPMVRMLSTIYIELIRGVPLITILFMAFVLVPLFVPVEFQISQLLRVLIGITIFASAYIAEVIRGGLQGIHQGQEEAAKALGFSYWQTMRFIILPQAIRLVIPPLMSTFIGLVKDTSLVVVVGLFDLLGAANLAVVNPNWLNRLVEAFVFAGFIYWVICFGMSRYSIRLKKRLETGL